MKFWGLLVASLAVVLFVGVASAQEENKKGDRGARFAEFLKKYDADGDGKLNDEERAKATADRAKEREELLKKIDAGEIPEALLARYDANKDGKLDDAEKAKLKEGLAARGGPGGRGNSAEFLKRFDKDGDGKLSDEERAAAREEFQKRRGGQGKKPRPST